MNNEQNQLLQNTTQISQHCKIKNYTEPKTIEPNLVTNTNLIYSIFTINVYKVPVI